MSIPDLGPQVETRTFGDDLWHRPIVPGHPLRGQGRPIDPAHPLRGQGRPITRIRGCDLSGDTTQTSGMSRFEAVSGKTVGSQHLWVGRTHVAAGASSGDHHHGEAETVIYVVSGTPRFVFAEAVSEGRPGAALDAEPDAERDAWREVAVDTEPGDFVFVPPWVPHREENPGGTEAIVVISRSTQEGIVVNVPQLWTPCSTDSAR